jgi:crossover junction endodeoxyribonuclease RusA
VGRIQAVLVVMAPRLSFFAPGIPVPQGSHRAFNNRVVDNNVQRLRPWRAAVADAAVQAAAQGGVGYFAQPVAVRANFYFRRPQSHYRTGKNATLLRDNAPLFPTGRGAGDLDKLLRVIGDSLVDSGVLQDDSLIAAVFAAKWWTDEHHRTPGVVVEVLERKAA